MSQRKKRELYFFLLMGACVVQSARAEDGATRTTSGPSVSGVAVSSAEASAPAISAENQKIMVEMWKRRILGPSARSWTPEDMSLLQRMREAENLDALDLLRDQMGSLRGYAISYGSPGGRVVWLTKAGFDQYILLKSQLARRYFEDQGTEAKFVFQLKSMDGRFLFDERGMLTPVGMALYNEILKGKSVEWKDAAGQTLANFRRGLPH